MSLRPYEMPWRPAYELCAAAAWSAGVLLAAALARRVGEASGLAAWLGLISLIMAIRRGAQARRLLRLRASLAGRAMETIGPRQLRALLPRPRAALPRFRLRVASGALAASVRARQDSVSRRRLGHVAARAGSPRRGPAGRRSGASLYAWRRAAGTRAAPPAAKLRGRHDHHRHHPVRQGRDPVGAGVAGRVSGRCRHHHRPEEFAASQAQRPARLRRRRPRPGVARIPPGLSGAWYPFRPLLQLAKALRARLAHPVGHAARHHRRLLRLRLERRQRRGAGPGRLRRAPEPRRSRPLHRGWHRAAPAALARALFHRARPGGLARTGQARRAARGRRQDPPPERGRQQRAPGLHRLLRTRGRADPRRRRDRVAAARLPPPA